MGYKTIRVSSELLQETQNLAERDGVEVEALLREALRLYASSGHERDVRPDVMSHFRDSLERNRVLYKLLAQ